jgi:hypothetical protein
MVAGNILYKCSVPNIMEDNLTHWTGTIPTKPKKSNLLLDDS